MAGKFQNDMAEQFYGMWNEGMHDDECYDGYRQNALFIDPDYGHGYIISEDEQGFVDISIYTAEFIRKAWNLVLERRENWALLTGILS